MRFRRYFLMALFVLLTFATLCLPFICYKLGLILFIVSLLWCECVFLIFVIVEMFDDFKDLFRKDANND